MGATLLKKIIKLAPDAASENNMIIQLVQLIKFMEEPQFREVHSSKWLASKSETKHALSDIYYMMGDYFMKNGDKTQALKNYQLDACFNPARFDTWAAIALCKAAEVEDNLRSFEHDDKLDQRKIEATMFAFRRALSLEENGKIMIEFGQFVYYIGARMMKLNGNIDMLLEARAIFVKVNETMPEEEWLVHYMQGKIYEKENKLEEAVASYVKSMTWMDQHGASYPKKVQYKQSSADYVHESLEMFYRVNAAILKAYLNGAILDLTPFKSTIYDLMKSNFYTRKGWNEPTKQPEEQILDSPEQILSQLGQNLVMIVALYPQHSKSYHLLTRLLMKRHNYEQARQVLFGHLAHAIGR